MQRAAGSGAIGPASGGRLRAVVPTIATVLVVAVCIAAGNWQRGRMHAKEALRAQLDAASAAPVAALPGGDVDWNAWRFRRVAAHGSFVADRQFLLDNRVHRGVVGFEVIAPLRTDDGRVVLVDRGFVPGGPSRQVLPEVALPAGAVEVQGRVSLPPAGYFQLGKQAGDARVQQHLDIGRIAAATGLPLMPIVIEATAPVGPGDDLLRDWPAPDTGVQTHLSYMVQWYLFAAVAATLWMGFTWRALRVRRAR
jgi:surfeit locus 1 family protein